MELHFGQHNAKRYNLFIDFEQMKTEFQNYEKWLPANRIRDQYARGFEEKNISNLVEKLHAKTAAAQSKFDYNWGRWFVYLNLLPIWDYK